MADPRNKQKVWDKRSRAQRKRAAIRIKNDASRHRKHLGGLFTSHDVIDGSSWADIYFLSTLHRHRIYNCTIDTSLYAYFSTCEDKAWSNSELILPFEDEPVSDMFVKAENGLYSLAEPRPSRVAREKSAFGGLSRSDWIDKEKERLADSGEVFIHPKVELDFSYRYGVGLHATLPVEKLTVAVIDRFIEEFIASGETPYHRKDIALSFPSARSKEASSINALCDDPSQWAEGAEALGLSREEHDELSTGLPEASASKAKSI